MLRISAIFQSLALLWLLSFAVVAADKPATPPATPQTPAVPATPPPSPQIPGEPPPGDPDPDLVLWHTYNESREDVLDWSHHGSIGEFFAGDRIPSAREKSARLYGQYAKDRASGYRILPTDALNLAEGTVTFWLCVDPDMAFDKQAVLLSAPDKGDKNCLAVVKFKDGVYELKSGFGKKGIETKKSKLSANVFYHVAWVFTKDKQEIWVNGEKAADAADGAALEGGAGLTVGYTYDSKKNAQTGRLSGVIDDLRIYNKPLAEFPCKDFNPTRPGIPPLGLTVDLDFNNSPKVINKSPLKLEIKVKDATLPPGPACPLIPGSKASLQFTTNNNENVSTQVRVMPDAALDCKEGTLEIYFMVYAPQADDAWRGAWHIVTSHPDANPSDNPHSNLMAMLWRPDKMAEEYAKNKYKQIQFCEMEVRSGTSFTDRRTGYMIENNKWVKLVFSWNEMSSRMWINDVRIRFSASDGFILYPSCVVCLGGTMANNGMEGAIARFRLWNYYRGFYPEELPMEGNLPKFNLDTGKK